MARISFNANMWDEYVENMGRIQSHNSTWGIIKKLCFGATTYYIWQERNLREFRQEERDKNVVINKIRDEVRCKLMSIRVKPTNAVKEAFILWEVVKHADQGLMGCLDD